MGKCVPHEDSWGTGEAAWRGWAVSVYGGFKTLLDKVPSKPGVIPYLTLLQAGF